MGHQDEVYYGKGYIKGDIANDDIAVTEDKASTAREVNFLSVFTSNDLSSLVSDGLLGLSPRISTLGSYFDSKHKVHLLVD